MLPLSKPTVMFNEPVELVGAVGIPLVLGLKSLVPALFFAFIHT
jgi:hypothetical protein